MRITIDKRFWRQKLAGSRNLKIEGIADNALFGIADPVLPINYTTFMTLHIVCSRDMDRSQNSKSRSPDLFMTPLTYLLFHLVGPS